MSADDVIRRALCLGRRVDQKLAIIAKLLQPSGDVRGLILHDCVRDSGFGAKIVCSHLGDEFFFRVNGGTERSCVGYALARAASLRSIMLRGSESSEACRGKML